MGRRKQAADIIAEAPLSEWDVLIAEAKHRIKELKRSIRVWQEFRDAGEPWPGGESEVHAKEA